MRAALSLYAWFGIKIRQLSKLDNQNSSILSISMNNLLANQSKSQQKNQAKKLGAIVLEDREEWTKVVDKMKETFKDDLPKYLCVGLYGQKIYRVDFRALGLGTHK